MVVGAVGDGRAVLRGERTAALYMSSGTKQCRGKTKHSGDCHPGLSNHFPSAGPVGAE